MREYDPGDELSAGPLRIRFQPVPHFVDSNAVEIASANGGGRITYGADHAPTDHIVDFARDTDLLVIEATLPRPEREGPRGHITPAEAGEHARKAGARRVLLTHYSDELGEDWAREDAERAFGRPVEMAHEGAVYDV
jgi:ribonuclease BN (tRNA processing enzyme)